ncbi:MAG: protein-glutamate O-methyltransferase CheR [Halobacteria archaeon]|nr:protein-glutamate O-methyltransferase CheR [Halobacteria archaeon]
MTSETGECECEGEGEGEADETRDGNEAEFKEVIEYVEDDLNFVTSYFEKNHLKRRLASRIRRKDVDEENYGRYLELLRRNEDEQEKLLDTLSINVTEFFRNHEVWEGIREVLRELSDEKPLVNVWSVPCSDGREPYSVAMLARDDPEIDASKFKIKATDIDSKILEEAREGVYRKTRSVNVESQLEFLDDYSDYIHDDGRNLVVNEGIKSMVDFEKHDIISGEPKSGFDLVICRNLFIYIESMYKPSVVRNIQNSMNRYGYLVIGKTETLPREVSDDFEAMDSSLRIYRKVR